MPLKRLLATACVALTAATGAFVVASATPATAAVANGAIFNDPRDPAQYYKIRDHIRGLIDGAPAGSEIRVAVYNFKEQEVADNLIAAKKRGVHVKVVTDSVSKDWEPVADLKTELGTTINTAAAASYMKVCTTGGACIGNQGSPIMHNKFYLFSSTNGSSNVVVQSSANLTVTNGSNMWQNAVTFAGNTSLYNAYYEYHKDLAGDHAKTNNYYRTNLAGAVKSYFYPRAGSDKTSDTVYNMLNENVACEGNTTVGTSTSHRTIIRIAMWSLTRQAIADELRALADKKCWVDVIYTEADAGVLASLRNHSRIALYQTPEAGGDFVHSKYLLIEGKYIDDADSKWVLTGSHNYTNSALRENDEAFLRIESAAIHDQFRANFRTIRSVAVADSKSPPALDFKASASGSDAND